MWPCKWSKRYSLQGYRVWNKESSRMLAGSFRTLWTVQVQKSPYWPGCQPGICSSLGKNLQRIRDITHLNPWTASKAQLHSASEQGLQIAVPEPDLWRPKCLANLPSLLQSRRGRSLSNIFPHWILRLKLGKDGGPRKIALVYNLRLESLYFETRILEGLERVLKHRKNCETALDNVWIKENVFFVR